MTLINQRRLEKKKKKRKARLLKLRNRPQDLRETHAGKSREELDEYVRFVESDNKIKPTDYIAEDDVDLDKVEIIGNKEEKQAGNTDDTTFFEKKSTGRLIPKKKLSLWQHFLGRLKRKWADAIIDNLFGAVFAIVVSTIMIFVGYHLTKNDVENLKKEISSEDSNFRKVLLNDIVSRVNDLILKKEEETKKPLISIPSIPPSTEKK